MQERKKTYSAKTIIGWREWCAMDDLALPAVAAKIDTGAKTSSLHAFDLEYYERKDERWVKFMVHPVQRHKRPEVRCKARVVETRKVVSSNGQAERRPVIETTLRMGQHNFTTEITLSNRDEMGFRMLVGRQTLAKKFVVDPALSWALGDIDESNIYPEIK
ncbi:MAG: RimK/LysX family protein [Gammaproteobacteria bacterium]|nr:RimK/LysX family protein [Gammaproteobacteria bacterium]MBT8151952.1 RimK/LysX family protein [Gammaproteobacteria bacterium]NND39149.1 ATP-dependent zinc protease [Pseudomonadales bacterium]NNM11638.1 ATP-dependent zinc protease [Pseudomonadales bacterium]RZV54076.1 MAG: ATP-dependent zinc protease [Pseudomonadales bacterium]